VKTTAALHMTEVTELLNKITNINLDPALSQTKNVTEIIKPLHVYTNIANRAWLAFQKPLDESVEYPTFIKMVDYSEIFLVDAQAKRLFEAVNLSGDGKLTIAEFENFLIAYDLMGQTSSDLILLDIYDTLKFTPNTEAYGELANHDGLDFSGFVEGMQMMGLGKLSEKEMMEAFCQAGNKKAEQVDILYLSLDQFKKAWGRLIDVNEELKKRGMKFDLSSLGLGRNRDRLLRVINDQEKAYKDNLGRMSAVIEQVKSDRRQRKDEKKREASAFKDKIQHDADKFIGANAMRQQEIRGRK
jgi:hypothetical protein